MTEPQLDALNHQIDQLKKGQRFWKWLAMGLLVCVGILLAVQLGSHLTIAVYIPGLACVGIMLAGLLGSSIYFAIRAEQERQRALEAQRRAEQLLYNAHIKQTQDAGEKK